MLLYPKTYLDNVKEIKYSFLKENNINALILDVDNTILDFDLRIPEGIKEWTEELKKQGIKFCILSNTNKIEKVKMVATELDMQYYNFAKKPLKGGFKKALKYLDEKPENVAAVGDQIFTDVIGANRSKIYSILVKPLGKKDIFITRWKRPLESLILKFVPKNKYFSSLLIIKHEIIFLFK